MIDPQTAALWSAGLVGLACMVSSAELLAERQVFANTHLLSWQISRYMTKWRLSGRTGAVLDSLLSARAFESLLVARLAIAAVALLLAVAGVLNPFVMLGLAGATVAINVRSPFGLDGAFQMSLLVAAALGIAGVAHLLGAEAAITIALWFIALQLLCSYAIAGVAKVISPVWRDGTAIRDIMSTQTYGNARAWRCLERHTGAARVLGWSVIALELTMPLVLVLPASVALPMIAVGVLFHLGTAVAMGLNDFLLSFAAGYPALAAVAL